jgi:HPr kinase/phosphorylase
MIRVYGTSVALGGDGILLRGRAGSGKSDLALRLIDQGGRLVADDQTELHLDGDEIWMTAPATIKGQIEVRGLGIMPVPFVETAPLRLIADLVLPAEIERLPEPRVCDMLGRTVTLIALAPFEASAPAKLRLALRRSATPVTP